ncbi:MAG: hypothetical protein JJV98_12810 [Desulfosarcina sp.]|nr:hypothetical protein [Desulfobacterales bacterium]
MPEAAGLTPSNAQPYSTGTTKVKIRITQDFGMDEKKKTMAEQKVLRLTETVSGSG